MLQNQQLKLNIWYRVKDRTTIMLCGEQLELNLSYLVNRLDESNVTELTGRTKGMLYWEELD